jgi:hypothetical protein
MVPRDGSGSVEHQHQQRPLVSGAGSGGELDVESQTHDLGGGEVS